MGGASGAGSLLLNTKASQEAACSRAPAAIAPGQEPEPHDAGMSRFAENGSHPAEVNAAEGPAGWVEGPGSSEFAKNGSHLAGADVAESHARAGCGCGGRATGGLTAGRHTSGTFGQSCKRASPARPSHKQSSEQGKSHPASPAKAAQQPGKISHKQGKTRHKQSSEQGKSSRAGQATIKAGRRYFFRWPLWSLQRP